MPQFTRFSSIPSVVTWLPFVNPSARSENAAGPILSTAKQAGKKAVKKKRPREACLSPESAANISDGRAKRDRKQTMFFEVDGSFAVPPPGSVAEAQASVTSWWPKLFDKQLSNPLDLTQKFASHVVQMVGTKHTFYIGCPVLVRSDDAGAGLIRAIVSQLLDDESKELKVKLISNGREVAISVSPDSIGTSIRFDREACGVAAVGRHAQVRFDDGTWFVGVISSVEQRKSEDGGTRLQLRVLFEDGDSVDATLPDEGLVLLPQEWTDHVQSKAWGWWGFNKDRVARISGQLEGGASAIKGSKGKRARDAATGGTPAKSRKSAPPTGEPAAKKPAAVARAVPDVPPADLDPMPQQLPPSQFQERMRGLPNCFFKGCPVLVNRADGQAKGEVLVEPEDGKMKVRLASSGEVVEVEMDTNSETPCAAAVDAKACGVYAVGRHAQVRFDDGVWYIGVIARTRAAPGGGEAVEVTVYFEDGEETTLTWPDPEDSIYQLPARWSDAVASEGVWGWWGWNRDRAKQARRVAMERARQQRIDAGEAVPAVRRPAAEPNDAAEPLTPLGRTSGRERTEQNYSKLAAGPRLDGKGAALEGAMEGGAGSPRSASGNGTPRGGAGTPRFGGAAVTPRGKAASARGGGGGGGAAAGKGLPAMALALSLCDSLRAAAFEEEWQDAAVRVQWRQGICAPENAPHLGAYIKVLAANLSDSALVGSFEAQRAAIVKELAALKGEQHARTCVQRLASGVEPILFKSAQQRALCCGPFLPK